MASAVTSKLLIPLVDISEEIERHVFVAPGTEEVYYCGPTTLLMPDQKTMYCVFTYDHGGTCGPMKKSRDGGKTWGEMLPVPDNWATVQNDPTIYRLTDPGGTTRLLVFAGRWGTQRPRGPDNTMQQAHSQDDGDTWTPMASNGLPCVMPFCSIEPVDGGRRLLGMTNIRPAENPLAPVTPVGSPGNRIAQSYSEDGGLTWSPWRIALDIPPHVPCEPALIRSPDGKQLLCLMRNNHGRWETSSHSLFMTSDDEGESWSKPQDLPLGLTGDRHMHCFSAEGRLLVPMRNTAPGVPERGDLVLWVGTYDDIVMGREGQYRVRLLQSHAGGDGSYPAIERLPDGTFVVTTYIKYRPGPEKHSIVSVRFTLAELDAKEAEMRAREGTTGA
jgi:hypothetical protein